MMLYKNTQAIVHSTYDDINFFDIIVGMLQGATLAPHLFIICLDNELRTSIDLMRENGFTLKRQEADDIPQKRWQM